MTLQYKNVDLRVKIKEPFDSNFIMIALKDRLSKYK